MTYLGGLYETGRGGLPKDYAQARQWYQKAADAGNAWAKNALLRLPSSADWFAEGKRYLNEKDYAQALPPLQKAAEAGNVDAMNKLGGLYEYGQGVTQDYAQARQWYQKAAEAGSKYAKEALSWLPSK